MKDKCDIGVIVGRFQVHSLTAAHIELLNKVKSCCKRMIIFIGVSQTLGTKKDPLGYAVRELMLREHFPEALITYIIDSPLDSVWSANLDTAIRSFCPIGSVCLYGGRDSFIKSYSGIYETMEFVLESEEAGTKRRKEVGIEVRNSEDFRAGVIHSTQNQYPRVFPTVDVAILNNKQVLLGKKVGRDDLCFIGGFIDPTDSSFEVAVKREACEETGLELDGFKYVGSFNINDWRYMTKDERIITAFFKCDYVFGTPRCNEEFDCFKWVDINNSLVSKVGDSHKPLAEALIKKGVKNG